MEVHIIRHRKIVFTALCIGFFFTYLNTVDVHTCLTQVYMFATNINTVRLCQTSVCMELSCLNTVDAHTCLTQVYMFVTNINTVRLCQTSMRIELNYI